MSIDGPIYDPVQWQRETIEAIGARSNPLFAVSLRMPIQSVFLETPRAEEYVPTVSGRPAIPAPTVVVCGRVFEAESYPWDYVPSASGRGQGEPKVQQFGRVFGADEWPSEPVATITGRGYVLPPFTRTGQIIEAEQPFRDYVPTVAAIVGRPWIEQPPRPNGRAFEAEPYPREYVPPSIGSPAAWGPQNPPRSQGQVYESFGDAPAFCSPISGARPTQIEGGLRQPTGRVFLAESPLHAAVGVLARSYAPQAAVVPPTIVSSPPYRLVAGDTFQPGSVVGQTAGQP